MQVLTNTARCVWTSRNGTFASVANASRLLIVRQTSLVASACP